MRILQGIKNRKKNELKSSENNEGFTLILDDLNIGGGLYVDNPDVTINIVKNNRIIEKKKLNIPERLVNVCKCNNPRCITSSERNLDQIFNLVDKESGAYRCYYCESALDKDKFIF